MVRGRQLVGVSNCGCVKMSDMEDDVYDEEEDYDLVSEERAP